jgi:glycosyltransferase involved in cell wall biosynthesis
MKISVVMATLDADKFLRSALDSIASQSRSVDELVIADGGSTDQTLQIAQAYPFARIVTQSGKGLPDAWNCALAYCKGDALAFLDSDDMWTADKIERQVHVLEQNQAMDAVVGHVQYFLEDGTTCPRNFKPELLNGTHLAPMPGALLIRRSAFDKIGLFDTRFPIACDIDWFSRLRDLNIQIATLPNLLIRKRVHQSNLSLDPSFQPGYQKELVRLLFEKRRRLATQTKAVSSDE